MLCPSAFQLPPPPAALTAPPLLDLRWPVRSLWPEARPLLYHIEQQMMRHVQEMRQSMEYMERLHQKIFDEIDQTCSSSSSSSSSCCSFKPIAFQDLGGAGGSFALSMDTQEFSPEELSVKQVGRRLRVSGRTERKQEDGRGSYSYRCQEFRQELDLPDGVDPEAVTCSLVGGRLQIQAPRDRAPGDGKERVVPISVAPAPAITSSTPGGGPEGSGASSPGSGPAEKD